MNSKKMIRNFFINKDLKKSKQFVHNYVYESNCFTSVDSADINIKKKEYYIKQITYNIPNEMFYYNDDYFIFIKKLHYNCGIFNIYSKTKYIEKIIIYANNTIYEFDNFEDSKYYEPYIDTTIHIYFNKNIIKEKINIKLSYKYYDVDFINEIEYTNYIENKKLFNINPIKFNNIIYTLFYNHNKYNYNKQYKIYSKSDLVIPIKLSKILNKNKSYGVNFEKNIINYNKKGFYLIFKKNIKFSNYILVSSI